MKKQARECEKEAWTAYWADRPEQAGGCLPGLPTAVNALLEKKWHLFFAQLPPGARLLDLGTGSGAVIRMARAQRPDLLLTGVDYADHLPALGAGVSLHTGTAMESLPFADQSFTGVCGQFALEYGTTAPTAGEVRRVLADKGSYHFICHHADGIIVRDNVARQAAIKTLLGPTGLLETALKAVLQRKKASPATSRRLARLFADHCQRHQDQALVAEVGRDIARLMTSPGSQKNLLNLRGRLRQEARRIEALRQAALTEQEACQLAALLPPPPPGETNRPHPLQVPGSAIPLAWRLTSLPE